jgi:hypothetical protein
VLPGLEKIQKAGYLDPDSDALSILIMKWYGYTRIMIENNLAVSKRCVELTQIFKEGGFRSCVLKGQGNALYYSKPELRSSGDIDLWVEGDRDKTVDFVRSKGVDIHDVHLDHANAEFFDNVAVEIHFQPSWMYNPFTERKLEKFFKEHRPIQFQLFDRAEGYAHPSNYFNLVFNLVHINRHIFDEGIGLRQIVDYYYILNVSNVLDRRRAMAQLKELKLEKFTASLMYVMQEVLGLNDELMLCSPIEKIGRRLLDDIMQGGNFGQYGKNNDQRVREEH